MCSCSSWHLGRHDWQKDAVFFCPVWIYWSRVLGCFFRFIYRIHPEIGSNNMTEPSGTPRLRWLVRYTRASYSSSPWVSWSALFRMSGSWLELGSWKSWSPSGHEKWDMLYDSRRIQVFFVPKCEKRPNHRSLFKSGLWCLGEAPTFCAALFGEVLFGEISTCPMSLDISEAGLCGYTSRLLGGS